MRTLVVYCHPDPDSFTASVRNTVVAALATARHEVRLTDLYTEGFEPRLSAEERLAHSTVEIADSLSSRGLTRYTEDLRWCESIVLVYPTWWSGQPAMLKGWIDRVWIQGVAWELPEGANRLVPLLKNVRRMTVVTTHGSSKWINALEGEAGKRIAFRSIRLMCHRLCRARWIALYNIDRSSAADREAFLAKVARLLSK